MQRKWTIEEIRREAAAFNWSKVEALSDEEITEAARSDPDSALPSEHDLAAFDLVIPAASRGHPPKEAAE